MSDSLFIKSLTSAMVLDFSVRNYSDIIKNPMLDLIKQGLQAKHTKSRNPKANCQIVIP